MIFDIAMLTYIKTTSDNIDFQYLVALLDQYLSVMDGDEHSFYAQYNKIDTLKNVVVCYNNNSPVGCGAFKVIDKETVEIKRMFVHPELRGNGIAFNILKELEIWAKELNYTSCLLETGKKQIEAVALYKKASYQIIPNYGQYENVENSICMKKII